MSILSVLFRCCDCGHGRNDTMNRICQVGQAIYSTALHREPIKTPSVPTSREDGDIVHVIERTVLRRFSDIQLAQTARDVT